MAKLKTIKIKNKTYKYKTIPSLAKQLKKSKAQTKTLIKFNTLLPKLRKKRQIQFKGKTVKFKTPKELGKKLNITDIQAVNLLEDYRTNQTKRYVEVNGDIAKYDLKDKPLVLQAFNIKKTSNKQFIGAKPIKKIQIKTFLPKNKKYKLFVVVKIYVDYWAVRKGDDGRRNYSFNTNSTTENLSDKLYDIVLNDYFGGVEPQGGFELENVKIYNKQGGQSFKLVDMELREEKPLDICNLFNEVIPNENSSNCVNNYISKIWKSKNIPKKDKVLFKSLHTTEDLKLFCEQRSIKMVAYNINGKVISSNYPTKKNSNYKNLIFIAYNNHLYPLQNQTLNKTNIIDCELIHTEDIRYAFKKVLKDGILPSNIKIIDTELTGFCVGKKHYYYNPSYDEAKLVLDTFGLSDHMTPYTNLKNVVNIVEKLYLKKENLNSFMPQANRFIKGGFLYKTYEDHEGLELETIDKNKSYPHALKELPFLIKTDIRYCKRYNVIDFKHIKNHHLYLIKVKKSSYLLPKNGIYTGSFLRYCKKEKLQFTIIEGLETESIENYLSQMIIHLYEKLPKHIFKECVNIYIGKFAHTMEINEHINVNKLANQEESLASDGVIIPFNKDYNFICENRQSFQIYNRKPIHIQILDQARKEGYEMLKKLSIKHSDIIQIKTDSITFKKNKTTDRKLKKLINSSIDGWKYEKYKALKCPSVKNNCLEGFGYDLIENNNVLVQAYAGAGKTYHIINEVIPKIENYLILTPSHASIKEYRKNKLNCKVIQYYTYNFNEIPIEDNIIIDEIGMVDRQGWDFIYKCILMGKTIMAYGDFKQLLPVSSKGEMNSSLWFDLAFKHKKIMKTNYRNTFTKEYYDSLINGKKSYITNEVVKASTPMKDAELILVFRNTIRHDYNKMMCDHLDIPYLVNDKNEIILNQDDLKIGTKIICIDNKLGKKTIYNKFCYTIKEINEDKVIITDDLDNITIDKEELEHFSFAYARTIYSIQGASIKSYHYAKEDLYFIDNRTAYTTISRIKNI
tara:strand:- start:4702 stop:7755 length:3054 start_codon:yes stop_codon:yes gene_type:complete